MANREFESANLMIPKKILKEYYIYYISIIQSEFNGLDTHCKYVADRRIKMDRFTKVIEDTDTYVIFEFDYDGTPRKLKGFKTKEFALNHLQKELR
jgi:hypothetical protein